MNYKLYAYNEICKCRKSKILDNAYINSYPVDTRRRFNVYKTSIRRRRRRIDVLQTLKRRRVSTGYVNYAPSVDCFVRRSLN